jgi:hypothetical protein
MPLGFKPPSLVQDDTHSLFQCTGQASDRDDSRTHCQRAAAHETIAKVETIQKRQLHACFRMHLGFIIKNRLKCLWGAVFDTDFLLLFRMNVSKWCETTLCEVPEEHCFVFMKRIQCMM